MPRRIWRASRQTHWSEFLAKSYDKFMNLSWAGRDPQDEQKKYESTPLSQIKTRRTTKKITSRRCHTPVCNQMCLLLRALSPRKWCQWEDLLCFQPVTGPMAACCLLPVCTAYLKAEQTSRQLVSPGYSCSLRVSFKAATSQIFADWLNITVASSYSYKLQPWCLTCKGKTQLLHGVIQCER